MSRSAIQTLGKYQILERIATGGMAEIYKARLEGIGGFQRTIAIKRILPNLSRNRDYIEMLRDEARVAGQLSHANIVQHIDLREHEGIWFIAMEYVHGRDLGAVLRRAAERGLVLPVPHAVFVTIELLKGLEYAHSRTVVRGGRPIEMNIIHRDVSPPNILLSYSGEVKLTDFGIAKAALKVMDTVSGIVRGRFDYMSPEQAAGSRNLDQRSDLFSVGIVLYEMLTGVHPFRMESELGTVERLRTGAYAPMHRHNPEVPPSLEGVVARALQLEPDDRFKDATEFKEALDRYFHDSGFYFTHNTLGGYIRGLFPDADPSTRRHEGNPVSLGGDEADDLDLGEAEQPTRRLELALVRDARSLDDIDDFGHASSQGTDAPTMIRNNPLLDAHLLMPPPGEFEDEVATVVRPGAAAQWEEANQQETVIRPNPLLQPKLTMPSSALDPRSGDTLRSVANADEPLPRPRLADKVPPRPSRPPRKPTPAPVPAPRPRPQARAPSSTAATIGWLGMLMLPVALAFGFVLGAAGTGVISWYTSSPGQVVLTAPVVRVVGPAATLKVDGKAYSEGDPLAPGPHEVTVTVKGREPVVLPMELTPGGQTWVVLEP
ncbi:MAG: serine/threonine protein kinase [Myxococcota bacterium]